MGAAVAAALSIVGGIATAANPPGVNGPGLAAVGPTSASDGFPVWYKDRNGLRLENCVALADPFCPARGALPDETAPVSFPDNYPDEAFYSLADTGSIASGNGGKARLVIALEQNDPGGPGTQVTFARVRVKISNLTDGVGYKITTPSGVETLQTDKTGLIFNTEDIGIGSPGDFTGALGGGIGPFLTWDTFPTDPALKPDASGKDTYVGDGATAHTITGSPYGTNFFRIEGPGINPNPTVDACPTVSGPLADCLETKLFSIQGKVATTSGVDAQQATYTRTSSGAGTVDVYAASELGPQAIQVSDASSGAAEFDTTGMPGGGDGHFFTRVAYTGANPPTDVRVTNTGDVPASSKVIKVVDQLTGTATYDTDSKQLSVNAVSSDTAAPRTLSVTGYGTLTGATLTTSITAPPPSVTVTSDAGGSVSLPVAITGNGAAPIPVVAQAGPDQTVSAGQSVTLDGTASALAQTFSWTSPTGITLNSPNSATPTFTAPQAPGDYTFALTVTGPGGPSTATVTITVVPAAQAVANAGTDQTGVQRGTKVTLDGSASKGAGTFAWSQVVGTGDAKVTLTGANTAKPSFTFPFYKFPANTGALQFNLHVTSPDGTASDDRVSIAPSSDSVTISKGLYTKSKKEWRIDGTSTVLAGQTVTVHLGGLNGPVLGSAPVDATGSWSVRTTTTGIVGATGQTVSAESQLGGTRTGFVIKVQ